MPYRFTLRDYAPIDLRRAYSAAQAVAMGVRALFNRHEFIEFHDFYNREKVRSYQSGEAKILTRTILNDGVENFTKELVEVPDLTGLTDPEAYVELMNVDLELGDITQVGLFPDVVSRQEPIAGQLVPLETNVEIWLDIEMKEGSIIGNLRKLAADLSKCSYTSRVASSRLLGGPTRLLK